MVTEAVVPLVALVGECLLFLFDPPSALRLVALFIRRGVATTRCSYSSRHSINPRHSNSSSSKLRRLILRSLLIQMLSPVRPLGRARLEGSGGSGNPPRSRTISAGDMIPKPTNAFADELMLWQGS